MNPHPFLDRETIGGYVVGEVTSALHKSIRRCEERQALWWATELDLSGFGAYVWRRLRLICSEDIGLAEPHMPATIRALFDNWTDARKAKKEGDAREYLTHAVLLLVRARKSRIVDNAATIFYDARSREAMRMQIPDYALDHHTARGRRMRRGADFSYDVALKLENQTLENPYEGEARQIDSRQRPQETGLS